MKQKTRELMHPVENVPAVAVEVDYWRQNGRAVGLVLQFCDGHRASLTYNEIEKLQKAATAVEEVEA